MANKTLTARVRLDTSQANRAIQQLSQRINQLNNRFNNINSNLNQANRQTRNIGNATSTWNSRLRGVTSSLSTHNSLLGSIGSRLKAIAATYFGIMGAKTAINTSDTITSAQNKLNYVSAQQLGSDGLTADGEYSTATINATQQAMDKMYISANKVRMGYTDMMTQVSKSMVLAGKSFDNNIDNAIRFQEIMAEAYTISGSSAQEMHSSMYQMIQALSAGVLQGDELRSVREGASLAYQEIEKFAQKVYDTSDSLKDMASDGLITSDMVVAAILNAGDKIDESFQKTEMTFTQAWTRIKNMAVKAFEPVSKMMSKMLNDFNQNDGFKKFEKAMLNIAKTFMIILKVAQKTFGWIADNWSWLSDIIIWGLATIITYCLIWKAIDFVIFISQLKAMQWGILFISIAVGIVVASFIAWKTGAIDTMQFILWCIIALGVLLVGIGMLTGSVATAVIGMITLAIGIIGMFLYKIAESGSQFVMWMLAIIGVISIVGMIVAIVMGNVVLAVLLGVLGLASLALAAILKWGENVAYWMFYVAAIIHNIVLSIWDFIIHSIAAVIACIVRAGASIINIAIGVINGIIQLINTFFDPVESLIEWLVNAFNGGFTSIAGACANLVGQICSWFLSLGEVVTKIIDAIFGTDWTGGLENLRSKVIEWGKKNNIIDVELDIPEIPRLKPTEYMNNILTFSNKFTALGNDLYANPDDWGNKGIDFSKDMTNLFDSWGDKAREFSLDDLLNGIGDKLGLDLSGIGFPDPNDLNNQLNYQVPSMDDLVNPSEDTAKNTKKMADSMDLAQDDWDYLRKLAEMEWRNEFTTAEINVTMTNNNQVNGDRDLDGMVSYLSEVLREEMTNVAYGVHY